MRRYGITYGKDTPAELERVGSAWLVERLPDELGRFFERIETLAVYAPAQLAACRSLRHLRALRIIDDRVTDADLLVHLKGLSNLRELDLYNLHVTDRGLVHLKGLSKLTQLYLHDTHVTDAGLVHLQGLSNLERLELSDTRVTDAGLVHLVGLSNLRTLYLIETQVTDAGVAMLKQALPNVIIFR